MVCVVLNGERLPHEDKLVEKLSTPKRNDKYFR